MYMYAIVREGNYEIEVYQDPDDPNHFYEIAENGRCVSDYDISELILMD